MYKKETIDAIQKVSQRKYSCLISHGTNFKDVEIFGYSEMPSGFELHRIMDKYRPFSITGEERSSIWVECMDEEGFIDLQWYNACGIIRYSNKHEKELVIGEAAL